MNQEAELVGDTVYVKLEDTLDTVYEKLMKTLRFLYPIFNQYEYLFRTNLSSFVDFTKYLEFCTILPKTNCCAAVLGDHGGIQFPSGAGFTLSMDLVKRLVDENPPAVFLDDVSVGSALANWNVEYIRTNRVDYRDDGTWHLEHPPLPNEIIFHYRAKTKNRQMDYNALQLRLRMVRPLLFVNR